MKNFEFRLQTLLKVRTATRDRCRVSLAEAYSADRILREKATQLDDELAELKAQMRAATRGGSIRVDRLLAAHRYELLLQDQRHTIGNQVESIAREIARRREQLVDADKQVRILDKLRQRQQDRFDRHRSKRECQELDEVATARASRQRDG